MSYLNRTNGYAPTGNLNSEPSPKRIVVKKMFKMWVGSCPVCAPHDGFRTHRVHQLVFMWAISHADKHRKNAAPRLENVERKRGQIHG